MGSPEEPLAILERWEAHGATWRILTLTEKLAVVELCTCDGVRVEELRSRDHGFIRSLRRSGSCTLAPDSPSAEAGGTRQVHGVGDRMDEIGPVDYAVIAFPGNEFHGDIAPALRDLVEAGTIRLIDAVFVSKDASGDVAACELTELAEDVQQALAALNVEVQGLFNMDELLAVGEELEPNSSAALLVWENVWARTVAQAMRDAGGLLIGFDRIPHAAVQAAREWVLAEGDS